MQDSSGAVDTNEELHDIIDIGANYVNTFGDANVAFSGRYGTADDNDGSNSSIWALGLRVGFGGFTVGGSYAEQNGASSQQLNGEAWGIGAAYETGPWALSVEYFNGENQDNDALLASDDETLEQFLVQITYAMGKGVTVGAFGAWVDFDEDASNDVDIDGFVLGTGISLGF